MTALYQVSRPDANGVIHVHLDRDGHMEYVASAFSTAVALASIADNARENSLKKSDPLTDMPADGYTITVDE